MPCQSGLFLQALYQIFASLINEEKHGEGLRIIIVPKFSWRASGFISHSGKQKNTEKFTSKWFN